MKAEERLKEIERTNGYFAIKYLEVVYLNWISSHLPFKDVAEYQGFDLDKEPFVLEYMILRIQKDTGVELPEKRTPLPYKESKERYAQLESAAYLPLNKANNPAHLTTFEFFWRIKYGIPINNENFTEEGLLAEGIEQPESKYDFTKGCTVRLRCYTQWEVNRFGRRFYQVVDIDGKFLHLKNRHGLIFIKPASKYEIVDEKK